MRFFFDNGLSPKFCEALRALAAVQGYEIVHLSEKFDRDVDDLVWLPGLAQEGDWVVISADPRISRGKATKRAWHESGLTAFFFGDRFASRKFWVQASEVVRLWPQIVLKARECAPGTGFVLHYHSEKMTEIYTPEGLAV